MDISTIKQDSAAIEAGQWIDTIPDWPGARFRVRGTESATATSLRSIKQRAVSDAGRDDDGELLPETMTKIAQEVLAEVVLLEWDGLTNQGKPMPYDKSLATELLTNPDFKRFQEAVAWCARKVDKLNTGNQKALEKNSGTPSSGS